MRLLLVDDCEFARTASREGVADRAALEGRFESAVGRPVALNDPSRHDDSPLAAGFVQGGGTGKARPASRFDFVFLFGPAFVPLAAFLAWGVFAWAVGLHWRAVLAIGVLACVSALGYAVVIASWLAWEARPRLEAGHPRRAAGRRSRPRQTTSLPSS
jgi:hypothetical protein